MKLDSICRNVDQGPPSEPGSTKNPSRLRWVMITLAFLATVINYLDRQTLSVVAPVLMDVFHMNNVDYSRILFAFMLAYTLSNGISGPLIDRLGTKLGYGLFMLWWSIASVLHALAMGPWSLGLFRFLLGIGEAGNWPGGVRVVAEWFPVQERALASGIFNSGAALGAILAPPIIVGLVLHFGWPAAFYLVGASGFVWLVIWMLVYHTPSFVQKEMASQRVPVGKLLRSRWMWSFMLSKMLMDPVWYFYIFWFPQYLKTARGFDLAAIGMYAWVPFLTADAGNLLGGWFSAILLKRNVPLSIARKLSVTVFAFLMTSAIPAVLVTSPQVSIALVSVATLGYTGTLANMLAVPADVFPKKMVGTVWGLAGLGTGLGGMLFSLVTGYVIEHYSYVPAFLGYGILPLLSALVLWLFLGPIRPGAAGVMVSEDTSS